MDDNNYIKYRNIWSRRYDPENLELRYVRQLADIKGKKILEIGSGLGRFTRILARYASHVTGIDNDPRMVKAAKAQTRKKNITYKHMDALDLKFQPRSFDIVIFSWTLVLLYPKEAKALKMAKDVLKNGGDLILIEPGGESDYAKIVKPCIPKKTPPIDIIESYEDPIRKVFRKDFQKIGPIKIPYAFKTRDQAYEVIRFAIEEWHKGKVDGALDARIARYTPINESLYFYHVSR